MSFAIDVRCLKGMYKQYGALPIFVRDRKGIEKPAKFTPLHSFVGGYYWHVMTIDDLDENDKKCTIICGPNEGKSLYPRGYKQDTLEFVETNNFANFDYCIVYCNGRRGLNAPCFTEVNVYDDKVVFFENKERIKEWEAKCLKEEIERQKKEVAERERLREMAMAPIPLPIVRKAYPALFADVLVNASPKQQKGSYFKLRMVNGTEETDGILSWVRKMKH